MSKKDQAIVASFDAAFQNLGAPHRLVGVLKTHKGGHDLSVRGPDGKNKVVSVPHGASKSSKEIVTCLRRTFGDKGLPPPAPILGSASQA